MTDSSDTPSALTASHLVTDHDVAARVARGHNLLRRPVHDRSGVARLVVDVTEWTVHNRELLTKRFTDHAVADAYARATDPFVVPNEGTGVEQQVSLLHRQLRHHIDWLERLRRTIPSRQQPASGHDEPRLSRHARSRRVPAVVATSASPVAAMVMGAVARATGVLPVVVEGAAGERHAVLRAAERALPGDGVAVVVIEPSEIDPAHPSPASLIALGYTAGALGADDVIAVCAPGLVHDAALDDFANVQMDHGDAWRHQLGRLLSQSGYEAAPVVSARRE